MIFSYSNLLYNHPRSPVPSPQSLLLIFVLFLSCQTTPKNQCIPLETTVPLDSGAEVYIFADVKEAKPILDLLPINELNGKQAKQMMEKTDFAAAALFPPETGRRIQLAAWGNYPSSRAGLAFGFSKNWKKLRSESGAYWYSAVDKFSLALNPKQAFAASWLHDRPAAPMAAAPGIEYPEGFGEFRREAPLSCWLDDPGPKLNRMLESAGLPLQIPAQKLYVNLFSIEGQYEATMKIQFSSAAQARGIAAAISLARNFMGLFGQDETDPDSVFAALFFANAPVQDDRYLIIKTAALSETEITLLFKMFLL